jgi:hypothetical protein
LGGKAGGVRAKKVGRLEVGDDKWDPPVGGRRGKREGRQAGAENWAELRGWAAREKSREGEGEELGWAGRRDGEKERCFLICW